MEWGFRFFYVGQSKLACWVKLASASTVGGPKRDPRAAWGLSIVYRALLPFDKIQANAGKRIEALHWQSVDEACVDKALAFDHANLINIAVAKTRQQINAIELLQGLLPEQFSLGELQTSCEHILGHRLDKSSFRRKLTDREAVQAIEGAIRRGANRPAQLYRLNHSIGTNNHYWKQATSQLIIRVEDRSNTVY